MNVRDVMTSNVVTATLETTLEEIAAMMKAEDTGAIPVVEEDELIGIITDRDIVIRCVAEGRDPAEVSAEDIVTEDIEVVDPETDVKEALEIMGSRQIRRLPVVDMGELVGMLSIGDLAVKRHDERKTGEVLKDVSQGVKNGRLRVTKDVEGEVQLRSRVVPIRAEENSLLREQRKSAKWKAS